MQAQPISCIAVRTCYRRYIANCVSSTSCRSTLGALLNVTAYTSITGTLRDRVGLNALSCAPCVVSLCRAMVRAWVHHVMKIAT